MCLRFQKMGRMAYWQAHTRALASLPLGDAHPGGTWPYARGEQLRGSAATTPRAAGPSLFLFARDEARRRFRAGFSGRAAMLARPLTLRASQATPPGVWFARDEGADFQSRFSGRPAMSARPLTLRRRKRRLRGFCLRGTRAPTFSRGLAAA